jgi:hypothetical protein
LQTPYDVNELDPRKKGKEYCIKNCKDLHMSNTSGISANFYNQKARWQLNRKYARGEQPINNIKRLLGRDKAVQYDSLEWTVPKVMPKIFDILIGMVSRLPLDVTCDAIDSESLDKKYALKYRAEAELMFADEIKEIESIIKSKLRDEDMAKYSTMEELELAASEGDFKVDVEIAMEEIVEALFDFNRIKELRIALADDIANCGMGILRHYVQPNGLIKVRRVVPELFISDYVQTRDFRDMSKAAEYYFVHWSELRKQAGSQFTDDEYLEIAIKVQGRYGNPSLITSAIGTNLASYANANGGFIFDNFTVQLMYCEWASTDRYVTVTDKPNKAGNKKTIMKGVDYTPDNRSKEFTQQTDYNIWYKGNWITDTEFIFDYGKLEFPNVKANQLNESQSTFAVCALKLQDMVTSTITERVTALMDNIVLNFMQYQSYLAKAVPSGIYAEMFALTNVPNGRGGTNTPLQNIERYVTTGNLIGNALLPNGQILQRPPIEVLNGSSLQPIQFFEQQIIQNIQLIKEFVGLNESTDASNPNPEASVTGQKLAVQGTNNSLQGLITCIDNIIEKTADGIINRCQHMASLGQLDYMANAIGKKKLLALSVTEDLSTAAMAVKISPRLDENEKAILEANIQMSLQQRSTTGQGGIEIEDALAIRRCRDLKAAEKMLILRRKLRTEQDMKLSSQKQQDNANVQQQSIQAQQQSQMALAAQELEIYAKKKQIDFEYKKQEILLQGQVKDENLVTQGKIDAHNSILDGHIESQKPQKEVVKP